MPLSNSSLSSWEKFLLYEIPIRRENYRVCCLVAMVFMPLGGCLELLLHDPSWFVRFLPLRLCSAAVLWAIYLILGRANQPRTIRLLGLLVAAPPIIAIATMIHQLGGAESSYYAGLNLVMVGAALLMRWTALESALVVSITLASYMIACIGGTLSLASGTFVSNLYFILVTGIIVVIGSWLHVRTRFSEFQLSQSLDAKHQELEEAIRKLEENNQKLRELDVAKSRFFANISHELRTPLTLLIAPVETLLNKGEAISGTERQEMLATMQANAMRLLKLINTLLELVRLDSQNVELRKTPLVLADFVNELGNACQALARDKHITLNTSSASDLTPLMADVEKLERVCLNLLFNSLKFTPAGGTISLTASREGENVRLQVQDTGVGISEQHLPHLFSRFWQADASSQRRFKGLGIGLALVKEIVDLHKGSISVDSVLGKGTIFTILLPYERATTIQIESAAQITEDKEPETGEWIVDLYRRAEFSPTLADSPRRQDRAAKTLQQPFRRGSTGKATLLIAEDEPDMMAYLTGQLSSDFDIIQADDGNEAVTMANQYLPDIILSDLMMPYKDGMQVCRELRNHPSTRSIPVLLLTARPDERSKIEALTAGATDFISKPFSLTEVRVRLGNLAESHRYQRKLTEQKKQLEATLEQLKETESLLVQHEKLSALGRMSAGLIHEINNPLNFATQGLYWLKQMSGRLPDALKAEFAETLDDIDTGVKRVVTIITDLRSFTRPNQGGYADFELLPLVKTVLRFFSHHEKDGVSFAVDVPEGLLLHGNHGHITQVLVNLLQNGIDATADKTYPAGEEPIIQIHASQKRDRVTLSVKDNGSGMSRETQDNVFDPFFTTKEVGKGLGLGLSICHRILADHQGLISIHSEQGIGTEFILDLPEASFYRTSSQETTLV
jgi:signal transduction histidine kinase